jgi:UTP--glucose-1-phosphate uridylyltransferase
MRARKVVIPAAGMGTRFLPATKALPKEMLPIVDKPSIQYVLEEALDADLDDVLVITGRGKRALEDHFDTAYELEDILESKGDTDKLKLIREFDDIRISYTRQKHALGLGHAVLQAEGHISGEPFVVMLPDDIVSDGGALLNNMLNLQEKKRCTVIALIEVPESEVHRYGVVSFEPTDNPDIVKIVDMVEKPSNGTAPSNLAVAGRYIINPDVFEILKNQPKGAGGEIQLTDALKTMSNKDTYGEVYGIIHRGRRFDTGDKTGFLKANIEFALQRPDIAKDLKPWLINLLQEEGK